MKIKNGNEEYFNKKISELISSEIDIINRDREKSTHWKKNENYHNLITIRTNEREE